VWADGVYLQATVKDELNRIENGFELHVEACLSAWMIDSVRPHAPHQLEFDHHENRAQDPKRICWRGPPPARQAAYKIDCFTSPRGSFGSGGR
jgi:hypothetical protein